METLAYADENKENIELIDSIIEKAKKEKDFPTGRLLSFWPVPSRKKTRRFISLRNR